MLEIIVFFILIDDHSKNWICKSSTTSNLTDYIVYQLTDVSLISSLQITSNVHTDVLVARR
jgi:hypothetical protein